MEYNFGTELSKSLSMVSEGERETLLKMIFKNYVARLLEILMERAGLKDSIEVDMLTEVKRNLISEFLKAPLGPDQRNEKFYEEQFDIALQEILNEASLNHQGIDSVTIDPYQNLHINTDAYVNEGGLYIPSHIKRR